MRDSSKSTARRGTFAPILAICCVAMFSMVALAIDLGTMTVARTHCQSAADTAALVGCRLLNNQPLVTTNNAGPAMTAAKEVATDNKLFRNNFTASQVSNIRVGVYDYNTVTDRFDPPTQWGTGWAPVAPSVANPNPPPPAPGTAPTGKSWTAVEVTIAVQQPAFFARIFGVSSMANGARALAVHRPRDIAFVLDYSGSMGYASNPTWPYQNGVDSDIVGMHGPDTQWPKFSHYARYTAYTVTPNTSSYNVADTNASLRPCPLQNNTTLRNTDYSHAPSNASGLSVGGPSMLEGHYSSNGTTMTASGFCEAVGVSVSDPIGSSTVFRTAFSWGPPRTAKGN
ncbi:MAG: pilus assembly protein TadG-related protein, partial [Fimbriiglobus sp.]